MEHNKIIFRENNLLKTNIKYAIIGTIIGLIISLFFSIFNPKSISAINTMFNVLFGLFITLSIANIVALVQRYFNPAGNNFWKFVLIFYVCNLAGMFIGIELVYLIISIIFDEKYSFATHLDDYKLSGVITLIIGTLILLYYFQRDAADRALNKKEIDLIRLNQLNSKIELQALQAKINPHFLYNALNSIASLVHEDPDKAEDMTLKLSKLFRYSMNTVDENFTKIKEELDILHAYLAIEKVRFGNRINFDIEIPNLLLSKQIPRFLLQPLAENALKHGLKDSVTGGLLKIKIERVDNQLLFYIYDNGIPFPADLIVGYGLQSTFDKLKLLYNEAYDIQINNTPEKHIKISIPIS